MKKLILHSLVIFISINLIVVITKNDWIYKAISITYLKGYPSTYIHDFSHFPTKTIEAGTHQEWLISKNYNHATLPTFIKQVNDSLETVALMVIKNDSILFEEYWHGYSSDTMSNSFSVAKSWVSTLVGIAIQEGKIESINQKVYHFIPEFSVGENAKITIKHLLTMSSGLNWKEDYYSPIGQISKAYYGDNLNKLVVNLKSVSPAGKVFKYHSSCSQLLAFIVEKATKKTISEYASEKLWKPMGAKHSALWSMDKTNGDEKAFCCINSNARDLARLGKLYLHNGNWDGVQIIDSSYVKEATSAAILLDENGNKNTNYGYQWWLAKRKGLNIYYARGLWGQYVICIPEKNMIIVRLGRNYGNCLADGHYADFYAFVDAAVEMYP